MGSRKTKTTEQLDRYNALIKWLGDQEDAVREQAQRTAADISRREREEAQRIAQSLLDQVYEKFRAALKDIAGSDLAMVAMGEYELRRAPTEKTVAKGERPSITRAAVLTRAQDDYLHKFVIERGLSKSEAIRFLIEDHMRLSGATVPKIEVQQPFKRPAWNTAKPPPRRAPPKPEGS